MNEVAEFTRYVGVIVLVGAALLLSPRGVVAVWAGALRWVRTRWSHDPEAPTDRPVVHVRAVPSRHHRPVEVLDAGRARESSGSVRSFVTGAVEGKAVVLALTGVALTELSATFARLPSAVVLAADLALVLAVFLVMRTVIRNYPAERLAAVLPGRRRGPWTWRGPARPEAAPRARAGAALPLVATVVALLWPTELGRWLAGERFGQGDEPAVAVTWACELLWLLLIAWTYCWQANQSRRPLEAPVG